MLSRENRIENRLLMTRKMPISAAFRRGGIKFMPYISFGGCSEEELEVQGRYMKSLYRHLSIYSVSKGEGWGCM